MFTDNLSIIKIKHPKVWSFIEKEKTNINDPDIEISATSSGQPTLTVLAAGQKLFIHSKFNPEDEALRFIDKYTEEEVSKYKHVFFYGIGLGYHIEAFTRKFPNVNATLYEPNPAIFCKLLDSRPLESFLQSNIKNIYIENGANSIGIYIDHFLKQVDKEVLIVAHPAYTKVYREKYERFANKFQEIIGQRKDLVKTTAGFEKLWTFNSVMNLMKVLETPSIFHVNKSNFKNKPAVIVSAGPSLQDEIENLKYIKENKLAYLFAVGSANKVLLEHGIVPDAMTTYDPNVYNTTVYEEIIEKKIDYIPLVFGSSVGFETTMKYPGPLLHMVTNQDSVSPYYVGKELLLEKGEVVSDAPSIAVITLELLWKLGCSMVILVGQNFAFRKDQYYSTGVTYNYRGIEVTEEERKEIITVEDVHGGQVETFMAHNRSRYQMEHYIGMLRNVEILNTTKGGAKINGAPFVALETLIKERLRETVVIPDWHLGVETETAYDKAYIYKQAERMKQEYEAFEEIISKLVNVIKKIESATDARKFTKLDSSFVSLDENLNKLKSNLFFDVYIATMCRVKFQSLAASSASIRELKNPFEKAKEIVNKYGQFIHQCMVLTKEIQPAFNYVQSELLTEKFQPVEK